MSDNVGSVIFGSGIVENVGVAVGIASPTLSIQMLFPLPVSTSDSVADTSGFRFFPMSGRIGSAISKLVMVENPIRKRLICCIYAAYITHILQYMLHI